MTPGEREPGWRNAASSARIALALSWASGPFLVSGLAVLSVGAGLIPPVTAWLQRSVLDALVVIAGPGGHRSLGIRTVIVVVLAIGGAGIGAAVVPKAQAYLQASLQRVAKITMYDRMYAVVASWPGIGRFESPDFADKLQLATQLAQNSVGTMLTSTLGSIQALVTAVSFLAMLVVLNPVLATAITAIEVLAIVASLVNAGRQAELRLMTSSRSRRVLSFGRLLSNPEAAKEVRLFGIGGYLRGRMRAELRTIATAERALDRRLLWAESGLALVSAGAVAAGLVWVVVRVAATVLPVGDVMLYIMAALGLQGAMNQIASDFGGLTQVLMMFSAYGDVVSAPPDLPVAACPRSPGPLSHRLTVDDVWFRYDEAHPWVLRGISLEIPAGAHVAFVGLNGSGKSTLVKLLCRLYDPVGGGIFWDGTDLRDLDPVALRQRITGVFQDFVSYELTAAENIGLGHVEALDDRAEILRAARLAGADADVARLPEGYDTMLSRLFFRGQPGPGRSRTAERATPDQASAAGVLLSGGQRQRLALARALMRADRDVLIVDEPTAHLDAEAEYAINRRLAEVRDGRTCVLISHRLSAVRDADQIFVLSEGKVIESGTHPELMAVGGHYERLYSLQAAGYAGVAVPAAGLRRKESAG